MSDSSDTDKSGPLPNAPPKPSSNTGHDLPLTGEARQHVLDRIPEPRSQQTTTSAGSSVAEAQCPDCGCTTARRSHKAAKRRCDRCVRKAEVARRWIEASPDTLIEMCETRGISRRFCRDGRPPTFDDDGLRERIAAQPLPVGGLLICGAVGSHKTHLAAARVIDAARRGYSARLINWYELCLDVRATYSPKAKETELDVLDRLASLDFLAIDDLGVGRDEQETAAALRLAYVVLNKRYEKELVTDVTTNLTPDNLGARFDERIARRLDECCTVYPMLLGDK